MVADNGESSNQWVGSITHNGVEMVCEDCDLESTDRSKLPMTQLVRRMCMNYNAQIKPQNKPLKADLKSCLPRVAMKILNALLLSHARWN